MRVTGSHVQEQLGSFRQRLELVEAPVDEHPLVIQRAVGNGVDSTAHKLAVDDFAQLPHAPLHKLIYMSALPCLLAGFRVPHPQCSTSPCRSLMFAMPLALAPHATH